MLKKILIIGTLLLLGFIAWLVFNPFGEPEFITIKNIRIDSMSGNIASVNGTAVFSNPNPIDATLLNTELKIYSNAAFVGNVSQTATTNIEAQKEFEIPLHFKIDLLKLGYSQSLAGLLENALSKEKVVPIRFEGYCRIKTLGATHKIQIEFEDQLKFE